MGSLIDVGCTVLHHALSATDLRDECFSLARSADQVSVQSKGNGGAFQAVSCSVRKNWYVGRRGCLGVAWEYWYRWRRGDGAGFLC